MDEQAILGAALQLTGAIMAIQAKHGWSAEDTAAVALAAATELVARGLGPAQTVRFFREHSDGLEREHSRRATI